MDDENRDEDLVVLGTSAGGLTGATEGLSTLVLEKTEFLGGTTAYLDRHLRLVPRAAGSLRPTWKDFADFAGHEGSNRPIRQSSWNASWNEP